MKPLLIFRHVVCEGPGYLAEYLQHKHIPFQLIAIDQGVAVPEHPEHTSGLIFMGGPMSVNDDLPWIAQELALIRKAVATGVPVLGHCLGGQLIAKALGAQVTANPVQEIGWYPIERTDNTTAAEWLGNLARQVEVFHWHGETFSIPPGSQVILRSEFCAHQAFVQGNILALQCHVEMTASMVMEWADLYRDEIEQPSASVQTASQLTADLDNKIRQMQRVAEMLYSHWIQGVVR
jgi:GMP synthase-like glutamine amidotransferase